MDYRIDQHWTPVNGIRRIEYLNSYGFVEAYGLIDSYNNIITAYRYQMIICYDETAHLAAAQRNGKWGYLDLTGKEKVACDLEYADDTFYCGRAKVRKYGKWGFMNESGELEYRFEFDEVSIFWDDIATVRKGAKWGAITKYRTSSMLFSFSYDKLSLIGDGIIVAGKKSMFGFGSIKYCLFNYDAHQLTDYVYDNIGDRVLSNGLILYQKGATRGYLDKNGHETQTFG